MNMLTLKIKTGLAAATLVAAFASVAGAVTVEPPCSTSSATISTACQIVAGNNDSVSAMNSFNGGAGVFGINDWLLADKSDQGSPNILAEGSINLTSTGNGNLSGTWSVDMFGDYTKVVLVIKGGAEAWAAYMLDLTSLSGTWSMADILNGGGNQPGLSHLSLYVADYTPTISTVPLPAGALLLLAGLASLAALRRKRRGL